MISALDHFMPCVQNVAQPFTLHFSPPGYTERCSGIPLPCHLHAYPLPPAHGARLPRKSFLPQVSCFCRVGAGRFRRHEWHCLTRSKQPLSGCSRCSKASALNRIAYAWSKVCSDAAHPPSLFLPQLQFVMAFSYLSLAITFI
jgi:hypothetical protein